MDAVDLKDGKTINIFSIESSFPLIKNETVGGVEYEVRHDGEVFVSEEQTEKILTAEKVAVDLGKRIMGNDFLERACGGNYVSVKIAKENMVQGLMYNSLIARESLVLMEEETVSAAILHEFVEMFRDTINPGESGEGVQLFTEFLFCGKDRGNAFIDFNSWKVGDPHTPSWDWIINKLNLRGENNDMTREKMSALKKNSTEEEKISMIKSIIFIPEKPKSVNIGK